MNLFDWPSITSNLVSDVIFLFLTLSAIPLVTIWTIKWRNRKALVLKFSHILLELCDFLTYTEYRHADLTSEHIQIFTRRARLKEYRFVALCIVNVFNPIVYPLIVIVVNNVHQKMTVQESYDSLKLEVSRMMELRIEIEKILSAHSMHIDERIILDITELCLMIRKLELTHKNNKSFEELSIKTETEMTGVFGLSEVIKIYEKIFYLIKEILERGSFDFSFSSKSSS